MDRDRFLRRAVTRVVVLVAVGVSLSCGRDVAADEIVGMWHIPTGKYEKPVGDTDIDLASTRLEFHGDGRLIVTNMPTFAYRDVPDVLSGEGTWRLDRQAGRQLLAVSVRDRSRGNGLVIFQLEIHTLSNDLYLYDTLNPDGGSPLVKYRKVADLPRR